MVFLGLYIQHIFGCMPQVAQIDWDNIKSNLCGQKCPICSHWLYIQKQNSVGLRVGLHCCEFQSCYLISSQTYILSYQKPLQKLKSFVTNLNGIMDKPIKIAFTKNFISIKINFRSWIYSTYFVYSFYCEKSRELLKH